MPTSEPRREPAFAGRFYPGDPRALRRELDRYMRPTPAPVAARMLMAPHAGYVYSGELAGHTWSKVHVPERVLLLCPNHTGRGSRRALWPGGAWNTPDGPVAVAADLTRALLDAGLQADTAAHQLEHAIEVHLPFLRARNPAAQIAALCVGDLGLDDCRDLGASIAAVLRAHEARGGGPVLLAASSDMSHYIPADAAAERDRLALDRLLALDPAGLFRVVERHDITMCGVLPTTIALFAALDLGATTAELVGYTHSGRVSGDLRRVVAYAGAIVR